MRRSSAVRVGTILLLASAWLASCTPKTPAPVAAPPVGVPPPPARTVSGPESPALSNPDLVKVFTSRGLDAREEGAGVVIYLPTVYLFAFGKSDVDAAARTQLAEIAGAARRADAGRPPHHGRRPRRRRRLPPVQPDAERGAGARRDCRARGRRRRRAIACTAAPTARIGRSSRTAWRTDRTIRTAAPATGASRSSSRIVDERAHSQRPELPTSNRAADQAWELGWELGARSYDFRERR